MSDNIDTRVSPSLHPDVLTNIDGYDDEVAPLLAQTAEAFRTAYSGLQSVHDAREAAFSDPTLTESAALLKVDDYAGPVLDRITRAFDAETARLTKAINHLQAELSQPIVSGAGTIEADSIRRHVAALPESKRTAFVQSRIEKGDTITVAAVLGSRPYLSGLEDDTAAVLTRMHNEKQKPVESKRLKVMQGALKVVESNSPVALRAWTDAVGCIEERNKQGLVTKRTYAADIRKKVAAASKPFARAS